MHDITEIYKFQLNIKNEKIKLRQQEFYQNYFLFAQLILFFNVGNSSLDVIFSLVHQYKYLFFIMTIYIVTITFE